MSFMPSAPMTAEEKVRLRRSGHWLLNHSQKAMEILAECHRDHNKGIEHTHPNPMILWLDVAELQALGTVLGWDGIHFSMRSEQIAALPFMEPGRDFVARMVPDMVEMFFTRHEMKAEKTEEESGVEHLLFESPPGESHKRIRRDSIAWSHEEFWGIPFLMDGIGPKQNCTFCGARSFPDRVLMACGRCEAALYCDKRCQKMHWKQKHKSECEVKVKNKENKAVTGEAA